MRVRALVAIWCRQHPNPNAAQDLRSEFVRAARHDQSEPAIARPGSQDLILLPVGALIDESIEATDMPVVGVLLIEELQAALVEHAKEFVPRHWDKVLIPAAIRVVEVDPEDLRSLDHRGTAAAFLGPSPNGVVIACALWFVVYGLLSSRCMGHHILLERSEQK